MKILPVTLFKDPKVAILDFDTENAYR